MNPSYRTIGILVTLVTLVTLWVAMPRAEAGPANKTVLVDRAPMEEDKRAQLGARVTNANTFIGLGLVALAVGVIGTVLGTLGAKVEKKKAAEDDRELCSFSVWGDNSEDCKPRTLRNLYPGAGYTTVAVMGVLGAVAGLAMTAHGAILSRKYARALEKYRPQVNIDPVNKRYSVSMRLSF